MAKTESELGIETSLDNLTELHREFGLPSLHEISRTKSGFLVDSNRLRGYKPTPPGKHPLTSWVWKHGEPITRVSDGKADGKAFWLCPLCYEKSRWQGLVLQSARSTNRPADHLCDPRYHNFNRDGSIKETKKRKREDEQESVLQQRQRQAEDDSTMFDRLGWQKCYLDWAIGDDISLRKATSKRLKRLLEFRNSNVSPIVPQNHSTTARWILKLFAGSKPAIIRSLARTHSKITISFDAWKSDNELDLLGIFAHYLDENLQLKTVMLGLRNTIILVAATGIRAEPTSGTTELLPRQDSASVLNGDFSARLEGTWSARTNCASCQKPNYFHRAKSNGNYVAQIEAVQSCTQTGTVYIEGTLTNLVGGQSYLLKFDYKFPVATTYTYWKYVSVTHAITTGAEYTRKAKANVWYTFSVAVDVADDH